MGFSKHRWAAGTTTAVGVALVLIIAIAAVGYFSTLPGSQMSSLQSQVGSLQKQNASLSQKLASLENQTRSQNATARINSLQREVLALNSTLGNYAVNQSPIVRDVTLTWTKDYSLQDRFFGGPIVVNQGDTLRVTFISNDTVTHTFTLASPYNFQINASMPGLRNDLTQKNFTTAALDNSPGVVISGAPGNVSATGSFVAKYAGIYSYVCIYHINVGMVGFLIVLPNAGYAAASNSTKTATTSTTPQSPKLSHVSVLKGSATDLKSAGYSPATITVVLGVNNTVVWSNNDTVFHTVTATDGGYSSGTIFSGQDWSHTFTQPGTYSYYFCQYHPWMKGIVIVKA
jgi:plastocyanin